jgi:hypothetical protein
MEKRKRGASEWEDLSLADLRSGDGEDGEEEVEADDESGGGGGGKRVKKTALACNFCRSAYLPFSIPLYANANEISALAERKLKCDGSKPNCSNCKRRKIGCEYERTIRRRGPGKKNRGKGKFASGGGAGKKKGGAAYSNSTGKGKRERGEKEKEKEKEKWDYEEESGARRGDPHPYYGNRNRNQHASSEMGNPYMALPYSPYRHLPLLPHPSTVYDSHSRSSHWYESTDSLGGGGGGGGGGGAGLGPPPYAAQREAERARIRDERLYRRRVEMAAEREMAEGEDEYERGWREKRKRRSVGSVDFDSNGGEGREEPPPPDVWGKRMKHYHASREIGGGAVEEEEGEGGEVNGFEYGERGGSVSSSLMSEGSVEEV